MWRCLKLGKVDNNLCLLVTLPLLLNALRHGMTTAFLNFCFKTFLLSLDIRKAKVVKGRSINLALSHRGRQALRHIGMEEKVSVAFIRLTYLKEVNDLNQLSQCQ